MTRNARSLPLPLDTTLFLLTIYKFYVATPWGGWKKTPLMSLIMRDGVWAFMLSLGAFLLPALL
jgi:hypothetical protein